MLSLISHARRYSKYRSKSVSKHSIHSPFVFDFVTKVIEDTTQYSAYHDVEDHRLDLLSNRNQIEIVDFGALPGKKGYITKLERVQKIAKRSAIPAKQGQLLYRIIKHFQPKNILELGTSLGISSLYQTMAAPKALFIGLEGCAATAHYAEKGLIELLPEKNFSMVIGNFDTMLHQVLDRYKTIDYCFIDGNHAYKPSKRYFEQLLPHLHNESVVIFHDIHWSDDMERAWEEIKSNQKVSVSIDLFHMGILFFRDGIPKQDFTIKF